MSGNATQIQQEEKIKMVILISAQGQILPFSSVLYSDRGEAEETIVSEEGGMQGHPPTDSRIEYVFVALNGGKADSLRAGRTKGPSFCFFKQKITTYSIVIEAK